MASFQRSISILSIAILYLVGCSTTNFEKKIAGRKNKEEMEKQPYVVLVSIDGYRFDYTSLYSPPALKKLSIEGAAAESLMPVFPSKTFTNHYSIATGLYAENHGIVGNKFYDPNRKEEYKLSDRSKVEDGSWYGGMPLWSSAEKQGMISASFFWPGSEAEIQGNRPTYFYHYNSNISLNTRVRQVRKWLELPSAERPHFIQLYFSDVDTAGHKFGPNSHQVKEAIDKVDQAIALLIQQLEETHLPVNLIIVSDHGMQSLDSKKIKYLDDYTNLGTARIEGDGTLALIYTSNSQERERIYNDLNKVRGAFRIYKREQMPTHFHYRNNARIGDLIVLADPPYSVRLHSNLSTLEAGDHGYDPYTVKTMHGIFYARGPQIKGRRILKTFRNIHIYPFISKILGLEVLNSIDGNEEVLDSLLLQGASKNINHHKMTIQ